MLNYDEEVGITEENKTDELSGNIKTSGSLSDQVTEFLAKELKITEDESKRPLFVYSVKNSEDADDVVDGLAKNGKDKSIAVFIDPKSGAVESNFIDYLDTMRIPVVTSTEQLASIVLGALREEG